MTGPRRDRTDPANYPETMEVTCSACRKPYTTHRQGTGKPWRGGLDYWYSGDHDCPEREAVRKQSEALNRWTHGDK